MAEQEQTVLLFREFAQAQELKDTVKHFDALLRHLNITQRDFASVYPVLKTSVCCNEARTLFRLLDKRAGQTPYGDGRTCKGLRTLVIGAGPCGLRMAIEASLLGARVVVIEMRDYILRNNILHLWPFVIHDLKTIGAKVFFPKFCSGNREHISIKRLQNILLKLALVVGVHVYAPVTFQTLVEPEARQTGHGWRVTVNPSGHPVESCDYDMIIGADGKRNGLRVFKRILFRGKMALGITANFVNEQNNEDAQIEELGGIFKIFKPDFFAKLKKQGDIDLENFVYFKNDTHYFVYTAKKACLLRKGVLRKDMDNSRDLLAPSNIDSTKLEAFAREAAHIATDGRLDSRPMAVNHHGQKDVALFDFTALHKADHSCMAVERHGKKLLLSIIGDTLIEPFWPTGSGAGRGFLSVFDAAWLMKAWCEDTKSDLEAIAEREGVYKLLSQTAANTLSTNLTKYTIDPNTRYSKQMTWSPLAVDQVRHLYRTEPLAEWAADTQVTEIKTNTTTFRMGQAQGTGISENLLEWFRKELSAYKEHVTIQDLSSSWSNGVALLCLLHKQRPVVIDIKSIDPSRAVTNVKMAFKIFEHNYGLTPPLSAEELAQPSPDRLAVLAFLVQLKGCLEEEKESGNRLNRERRAVIKRRISAAGMLMRLSKKAKRSPSDVLPSKPRVTASRRSQPAPPLPQKPDFPVKQKSAAKPPALPPRRPLLPVVPRSVSTLDRCQAKQLAKSRIQDWESNMIGPTSPVKKSAVKTSPPRSPSLPQIPAQHSGTCSICARPLLVADRQSAHGYFFHRNCFRCHMCKEPLWTPEATPVPEGGNGRVCFMCPRHSPTRENQEEDIELDTPIVLDRRDSDSSMEDEEIDPDTQQHMNLSDWMGTMMIEQDKEDCLNMSDVGVMGMMMGGQNLDYVAVGEEESSDEDDNESVMSGESTLRRKKKTLYSLVTSVQLMLGHHIQQELGETETEETELEQVGKQMEEALRNKRKSGFMTGMEEQVTHEFLQLMEDKRRLKKRQSKLLLKAKLLELQNRHSQLANEMQTIQNDLDANDSSQEDEEDDQGDLECSRKIDILGQEMSEVEKLASEIHMYFKDNGESLI